MSPLLLETLDYAVDPMFAIFSAAGFRSSSEWMQDGAAADELILNVFAVMEARWVGLGDSLRLTIRCVLG